MVYHIRSSLIKVELTWLAHKAANSILKITGTGKLMEILQVKYLNNILE